MASEPAVDDGVTNKHEDVLLFDKQRLVGEAIGCLIARMAYNLTLVHRPEDLEGIAPDYRPSLVVAEIENYTGTSLIRGFRQRFPGSPVLCLTADNSLRTARAALDMGAQSYVLKHADSAELRTAMIQTLAGRSYMSPQLTAKGFMQSLGDRPLTARQRDVLALALNGGCAKSIAFALGLSVRTVEAHLYSVFDHFGVHSRVELFRTVRDAGLGG